MTGARGLIVLNPEGIPRARSGTLAPRLAETAGAVIGLIHDGQPGSTEYMDAVAERLRGVHGAEPVHLIKPLLTRPAPPELIERAAKECDAIVSGVGR